MGRALAEAFPESREVYERADRVLGTPISRLCFDGPDEELALTRNTQPAILTTSVAALRPLELRGLRPVAAAGHSLGEYSAHVCAGTIDFDGAVTAVRERGQFMQEAVPVGVGAMAAIMGLDPQAVADCCAAIRGDEVVSPANLNAPGQVVIAGHAAAVTRAIDACSAAGATRAIALAVSAPFHCSLMGPAERRLRPVLEALPFRAPAIPVYTNVDAGPAREAETAREALVRQVTAPVRWDELMRAMIGDGIESFVEVGPGRVLAGLARRIRRGVRVLAVSDPDGVERAVRELGGES
jgi:[acyl-carrier-protein] S-malonyltransferase